MADHHVKTQLGSQIISLNMSYQSSLWPSTMYLIEHELMIAQVQPPIKSRWEAATWEKHNNSLALPYYDKC